MLAGDPQLLAAASGVNALMLGGGTLIHVLAVQGIVGRWADHLPDILPRRLNFTEQLPFFFHKGGDVASRPICRPT